MFDGLKNKRKLNNIQNEVSDLILKSKEKPLSEIDASKIYAKAVEKFAIHFECTLDGLNANSTVVDVVENLTAEAKFNSPISRLENSLKRELTNFHQNYPDSKVDMMEYYDQWDDEYNFQECVYNYSEIRALFNLYKNDCYDFLVDAIARLVYSAFNIQNYFIEPHRLIDVIESSDRKGKTYLSFHYWNKWLKSPGRDFYMNKGELRMYHSSEILGSIPLGIERYYKFPKVLKANNDLCKINNFKDIISEMESLE